MRKLLFTLSLFVATNAFAENVHVAGHADWMKNLRDDARVGELCLPGAHDAATGQTHVYGTSVQTKTIKQMFEAGVRVFDFRVGYPTNTPSPLRLYHNFVDLARLFTGVMEDLYDELDDHPSEFCVVIIKHEGWLDNDYKVAQQLRSYFRPYFNKEPKLYPWYGDSESYYSYWHYDEKSEYEDAKKKWHSLLPYYTVHECRGKVLLSFRKPYLYDGDESDMVGPILGSFTSNPEVQQISGAYGRSFDFICQDAYHEDDMGWNINYKFERYVKPCCEAVTNEISKGNVPLCINHLSGYTNDPAAPNSAILARATNRLFAKYLAENPDVYTGMVMMDYAAETTSWGYTVSGDLAVEAVIHQNWRYWNEQPNLQEHPVVNSN